MSVMKLENISKKFGEKTIFEGFSIEIQQGDYVSIMGESGRGKTTLLNILGMLEAPDSGNVIICGKKNPKFISRATRNMRRKKISYLFQNYGLIDTDTVEENLKLVLKYKRETAGERNRNIAAALKQVGLSGFEKRKIFTLSGGEQQRVALAKIILKNPQIILADEPTGSLDSKNRDYVLNILEELNKKGKTIVVVTHDKEVAKCAHLSVQL
ncbi:MAG: ABC transporter ATP-binding protein [Lachnospiraceae bacterium]|nr:ABC transporter ATP-binding protein [Lachnospiraceae bacterium]